MKISVQETPVGNLHEPQAISQEQMFADNIAYEDAYIMGGLYGDGIIALKGAFSREWVKALDEDLAILYEEALKRPGGAVGSGPKRH